MSNPTDSNEPCGHQWCHVDRQLHPAAEKCIYCGCPNDYYDGGQEHPFDSESWSALCKCNRTLDHPLHGYVSSSPPILRDSGVSSARRHFGFSGNSIAADVMDLAREVEFENEEWRERGIDEY